MGQSFSMFACKLAPRKLETTTTSLCFCIKNTKWAKTGFLRDRCYPGCGPISVPFLPLPHSSRVKGSAYFSILQPYSHSPTLFPQHLLAEAPFWTIFFTSAAFINQLSKLGKQYSTPLSRGSFTKTDGNKEIGPHSLEDLHRPRHWKLAPLEFS